MVEVTRKKYPLNPTLRLVTPEGRATSEFFRVLKAIGDLINNIEIEDGEVTADKIQVDSLEAISANLGNVVVDGDLVVNGTITTGKVALNAITDTTVAFQAGPVGPANNNAVEADVPVTDTGTTGVLVTFTAFQSLPNPDPANAGYWQLRLLRNGVQIEITPPLYYDDNFAQPATAIWIDSNPGIDPHYEIRTNLSSGLGFFTIDGGVGVFALFKR